MIKALTVCNIAHSFISVSAREAERLVTAYVAIPLEENERKPFFFSLQFTKFR